MSDLTTYVAVFIQPLLSGRPGGPGTLRSPRGREPTLRLLPVQDCGSLSLLGLIPPPHVSQAEGLNLLRRAEKLWQDHRNPSTDVVYFLACTQAVIARRLGRDGAEAAERDRYERSAMGTLSRAIAAGYKDVGNIRSDTDLDALRGREDFKKLIAELEKKVEKK